MTILWSQDVLGALFWLALTLMSNKAIRGPSLVASPRAFWRTYSRLSLCTESSQHPPLNITSQHEQQIKFVTPAIPEFREKLWNVETFNRPEPQPFFWSANLISGTDSTEESCEEVWLLSTYVLVAWRIGWSVAAWGDRQRPCFFKLRQHRCTADASCIRMTEPIEAALEEILSLGCPIRCLMQPSGPALRGLRMKSFKYREDTSSFSPDFADREIYLLILEHVVMVLESLSGPETADSTDRCFKGQSFRSNLELGEQCLKRLRWLRREDASAR